MIVTINLVKMYFLQEERQSNTALQELYLKLARVNIEPYNSSVLSGIGKISKLYESFRFTYIRIDSRSLFSWGSRRLFPCTVLPAIKFTNDKIS